MVHPATREVAAGAHFRADPVDRWPTAGVAPAHQVDDLGAEVEDPLDHRVDRLAAVVAAGPAVDPVVVVVVGHPVAAVTEEGSYRGSVRADQVDRETGRESWHPVVEDDTAAGHPSADCRDGVVEPIPAGVRRKAAEADRVAVAAVGPAAVPVDPDRLEAAAAVGSGHNCWDNDAADAAAVDAIVATNLGSVWDLAVAAVDPGGRDVAVVVPDPDLACTAAEAVYWEESWNPVCRLVRPPFGSGRTDRDHRVACWGHGDT